MSATPRRTVVEKLAEDTEELERLVAVIRTEGADALATHADELRYIQVQSFLSPRPSLLMQP